MKKQEDEMKGIQKKLIILFIAFTVAVVTYFLTKDFLITAYMFTLSIILEGVGYSLNLPNK